MINKATLPKHTTQRNQNHPPPPPAHPPPKKTWAPRTPTPALSSPHRQESMGAVNLLRSGRRLLVVVLLLSGPTLATPLLVLLPRSRLLLLLRLRDRCRRRRRRRRTPHHLDVLALRPR